MMNRLKTTAWDLFWWAIVAICIYGFLFWAAGQVGV